MTSSNRLLRWLGKRLPTTTPAACCTRLLPKTRDMGGSNLNLVGLMGGSTGYAGRLHEEYARVPDAALLDLH